MKNKNIKELDASTFTVIAHVVKCKNIKIIFRIMNMLISVV
jgi:hypothetical protein